MTSMSSFNVPLSLRLSGSGLKLIAVISMVIDHIAWFFIEPDTPAYHLMRTVGRIAFPVFAFLIAEGAAYSRSRWRYFLLLLGFGFISEIPWMFATGLDGSHNVMFTLALGLLAICVFDRLCEHGPICFMAMVIFCVLAYYLRSDYDWRGVLMIILFYMLRVQTACPWTPKCHIHFPSQSLLQVLFTFPLMMHYGLIGVILASFVIILYDGSRGNIKGIVAKYSFYAFYPVHLLLFSYLC
ncbi:MAG: conjugal transfer protein TraX [Bacteroidales bacterium]|nr:conjugal transfer protein TraX [Bacteroidales bacterium]